MQKKQKENKVKDLVYEKPTLTKIDAGVAKGQDQCLNGSGAGLQCLNGGTATQFCGIGSAA